MLLRTDILQKTVVGCPCALTFFLSIILESPNTRTIDDRSCLSIISILNPSENLQYSKETDLNWTETPEVLNVLPRDPEGSCDKKVIWDILREKKPFVLIIFTNVILFQDLDSDGIKTSNSSSLMMNLIFCKMGSNQQCQHLINSWRFHTRAVSSCVQANNHDQIRTSYTPLPYFP